MATPLFWRWKILLLPYTHACQGSFIKIMITFFPYFILTELDTLQGDVAPLGPSSLKFCVHP